MYSPHPQLCVDESMIGTKCRLSFIQYIKAKPIRGSKSVGLYRQCNRIYLYNFSIYTGKDPSHPVHPHGVSYDIVATLMKDFENKGYTVNTDNYYTSPISYKDLLEKGIYANGTVRKNRKHFPQDLLQEHTFIKSRSPFCYNDHLTAVKLNDRREVCALSTYSFI